MAQEIVLNMLRWSATDDIGPTIGEWRSSALPLETIARVTGLTVAQLEQLQAELEKG
jgi:hypothetical protein